MPANPAPPPAWRRRGAGAPAPPSVPAQTWPEFPPPGRAFNNSWQHPRCYQTIRAADIEGDGKAELVGGGRTSFKTWKWTGCGWEERSFGERLVLEVPRRVTSDSQDVALAAGWRDAG